MLATEFMLLLAAAASAAPLAALSHPPAASLVAPHVQLQEEHEQLQTNNERLLCLDDRVVPQVYLIGAEKGSSTSASTLLRYYGARSASSTGFDGMATVNTSVGIEPV